MASVHDDRREEGEVLYGRSSTLRVFISSEMRSGRLRRARVAVASVVDEHPDAEPWLWERHARPGRYSAFEVCVGTAKTSDILVLILAEELTDVTEAEWRAAKGEGANCALLVKEGSKLTPRAHAFLAAERRDCIYLAYADMRGLRRAVRAALTQCMTDAVRRRALARRARDAGRGSPRMHLVEAGIERANQLYRIGAIDQAREVLDEINVVAGAHNERSEDLELLSGLVAGADGHVSKAAAAYLRVIRNPRSSGSAKAIAYQNLGLEAMRAGQFKAAASYMKSSLRRHHAGDDWFGVLQVLLNMGNLALEQRDTDSATELANLASELEPFFIPSVPYQRASIKGLRANIAAQLGRHTEALSGFKATYAAYKRLGDADGQIVGCQNVAAAYKDLGRPALARLWVRKALDLAEDQGPTWRREEVHRTAALIAMDLGRLPEARHHFESARGLASQMDDCWRVATLTADIGAVLAEMDSDEAFEELERARVLLTEVQDSEWLARVGMNRAVITRRRGDTVGAVGILEELTGLSHVSRDLRGRVLEQLARLQLDDGRGADATRNFKKAFALQGRTPGTAITAALYAHELQDAGEHKHALRLFDSALTRARTGDDPGLIHDVQSDRALLLAAMGNEGDALVELEACLDVARSLRDTERTLRALHNVGEMARRAGDNRKSLKVLRSACALADRAGDEDAHRSAKGLLAMAQVAAGRFSDAEQTASTLRHRARLSHDRANESAALGVLGSCAFAAGDYVRAAELYRTAARLNVDDAVHHAEDLSGVLESHAAAGRWRPTLRAAQALVIHAQGHKCEGIAWPSLASAARWFLDRGQQRRAGLLTAPAWVLASETEKRPSGPSGRNSRSGLADTELLDAVMTTAFHEQWTTSDRCELLYEVVVRELDLPADDNAICAIIAEVRAAVRDGGRTEVSARR